MLSITKKLKFCGSSIDKIGHRRWFESQYPEVKKLVEDIQETVGLSFGKVNYRELTKLLEAYSGLEQTKEED